MSDESRPREELEPEEDVEAQLLKESLGAGLAAAAIFAGASQAASYPVPTPPGAADAAAEVALIPKRGETHRQIQRVRAKAATKATAKKVTKAKKTSARRGAGGRSQPL